MKETTELQHLTGKKQHRTNKKEIIKQNLLRQLARLDYLNDFAEPTYGYIYDENDNVINRDDMYELCLKHLTCTDIGIIRGYYIKKCEKRIELLYIIFHFH